MAQWMDIQRIEKFENATRLYINCEKSGGLYLTWSYGRLAGRLTKFGRGLKF